MRACIPLPQVKKSFLSRRRKEGGRVFFLFLPPPPPLTRVPHMGKEDFFNVRHIKVDFSSFSGLSRAFWEL